MEQIRKLPIGIQTFDKLREGGFLYPKIRKQSQWQSQLQ